MCTVEVLEYNGLKNCIKVSNGKIELIAVTCLGPRIIRYGFIGGANEFLQLDDQLHNPTEDEWQIFGGHRLWHSPELEGRSNLPDCYEVGFELTKNGFVLSQPTESITGVKKTMTISMNPDGSVELIHQLTNEGIWPVELSVWALTVMAPNGVAVVQNPNRDTGFLSNRTLSLWPYAKLNDPRVKWGDKYIFLKQSPEIDCKFKFGFPNEHGWAAYFNNGNMFVKRHVHLPTEVYPDNNCSYETFTNADILEIETLSPLVKLQPGEFEEHFERWELYKDIVSPKNEKDVDKLLLSFGGTSEKN